jgi:hypothetical protein
LVSSSVLTYITCVCKQTIIILGLKPHEKVLSPATVVIPLKILYFPKLLFSSIVAQE